MSAKVVLSAVLIFILLPVSPGFIQAQAGETLEVDFLTYFGTSSSDEVRAMAIDDNGDIVIAGQTNSYDFPLVDPSQETNSGGLDIYVTKISGANHSIIFSTYYGGGGQEYLGSNIAIDSEGNIIIGGATASRDLPLLHPYQEDYGGGELDAFIVKYSPDGTLLYSSYIGGSALDWAYGISVDSEDNFVFTGHMTSPDYPVVNAIQDTIGGNNDAVITKMSSDGQEIIFSTFLGGPGEDLGLALAVDKDDWIIAVGLSSDGFPVHNPIQEENAGTFDTFITKLSSDGQTLNFSTHYGGTGEDGAWGIDTDSRGNIIVGGRADSDDVPTINAFQEGEGTDQDGFVLVLSSNGVVQLASYVGGSAEDMVWDVAVDTEDSIFLAGYTSSNDFPTLNPVQENRSGSYDAFLVKLNCNASLEFATYLGGSSSDYAYTVDTLSNSTVYIAGRTTSDDLDTIGAIQEEYAGSFDSFLCRFTISSQNPAEIPVFQFTVGIGIVLIIVVVAFILKKRGG